LPKRNGSTGLAYFNARPVRATWETSRNQGRALLAGILTGGGSQKSPKYVQELIKLLRRNMAGGGSNRTKPESNIPVCLVISWLFGSYRTWQEGELAERVGFAFIH